MESVLERGRVRAVLITLCAVFVTWRVAGSAAQGVTMPALALVGGLAALVAVLKPRLVLVLLLAVGVGVLPDRYGTFGFGGARSDVAEALAFLLIGAWVVHALMGHVGKPRFVGPLVLMQVGVVVGLIVGYRDGATGSDVFGGAKDYAFYLLLLVLTSFVATRSDQDWLERWVLRLCTFGSAVTLSVVATGTTLGGTLRTTEVETLDAVFSAQRVRFPLLSLTILGFLLMVGRVLDHAATNGDYVRMALYLVPVLFSFNRSSWVPLLLAVVVLSLVRQGPTTALRGIRLGLSAVVIAATLYTSAAAGALGPSGTAMAARISSTFDKSVTQETSYEDRQSENRDAFRAIGRSPLVGVGVGRPYGAVRAVYLDNPPRIVYVERPFIHNTYLGVWLQIGLLGFTAFLLLGASIVREAIAAARELAVRESTRHIAAATALLTFGLGALLRTDLRSRGPTLAAACALALLHRPQPEPVMEELVP